MLVLWLAGNGACSQSAEMAKVLLPDGTPHRQPGRGGTSGEAMFQSGTRRNLELGIST